MILYVDAAVQIGEVTSHINEYIRQHEIFKKMLSIQNSLTGNCVPSILAPGRKFIQEGRLMKVCQRKGVVEIACIIFISWHTGLSKESQREDGLPVFRYSYLCKTQSS